MTKKRLAYIDYARGIGIILMVMGHIGFGERFYHYIHAFHMPVFFVMSGYLYREKESLKQEILKKVKQLIVPYISIGAFHYAFWLLIHHGENNLTEPLINLLWVNTNTNMPIAGALWFLTCLFFVDIIFMLVDRYMKRISGLIFVIIAVFGSCFTLITDIRLPWAIDTAMVGVGFYYSGYLLKKYSGIKYVGKLMDLNIPETIIGFVVFSVLIFLNGTVNMRTGDYAVIPLSWVNGIGFSIILLNICKLTEQAEENSRFLTIICNVLKYVGANSIVYLCFNQLCILILNKVRAVIFTGDISILLLLIIHIVMLILTMAMLYIISRIFMNTKLKVFVGR